jgi:maleylacetoacetate isomerase
VRALAQIVACDSHPLLVPRVREYLEHELKLDEPTRLKWIHHWIGEALQALESNLAGSSETGRYCQGDSVSIADICLVSQATGANLFKYDLAGFPTVRRIADACMQQDAFARAHPLRQPGAPQAA